MEMITGRNYLSDRDLKDKIKDHPYLSYCTVESIDEKLKKNPELTGKCEPAIRKVKDKFDQTGQEVIKKFLELHECGIIVRMNGPDAKINREKIEKEWKKVIEGFKKIDAYHEFFDVIAGNKTGVSKETDEIFREEGFMKEYGIVFGNILVMKDNGKAEADYKKFKEDEK